MDMEQNNIQKTKWVKCQSKSRPGRFYLFNTSTGETKWYKEETSTTSSLPKETSLEEKSSFPKCPFDRKFKTPAQDRLKRLQSKLKTDQKHEKQRKKIQEEVNNNNIKTANVKSTIQTNKEQQKPKDNVVELDKCKINQKNIEQPTTSAVAIATLQNISSKTNNTNTLVKWTKMEPKRSPQKGLKRRSANLPDSPGSAKTSIQLTKTIDKNNSKMSKLNENNANEISRDIEDALHHSPSTWNTGKAIVSKITEMCKNTLKHATKALEDSTRCAAGKQNLKTPKKEEVIASSPILQECSQTQKPTSPRSSLRSRTVTPNGTPKNLRKSPNHKGSANSRLERLRRSLQMQQSLISNGGGGGDTIDESVNNNCSKKDKRVVPDDCEPMDWQPIDEVKSNQPTEVLTLYTNNSMVSRPNCSSMSEYYDVVNENLLRLTTEQQSNDKTAQRNWLQDHYYFIIDTNVLLQQLTFVDELRQMKLCDTNGTIIYLPYMVLQELDKLKMRASSEGAKTLAIRAVKYLNSKMEAKNVNIQAQNATEECNHLIEVSSPDDSIINCCLQAKQHVNHLVLLTEDVNLRNKALCNNLLVSTKSDLLSKHATSLPNESISFTKTTTITNSFTTTSFTKAKWQTSK